MPTSHYLQLAARFVTLYNRRVGDMSTRFEAGVANILEELFRSSPLPSEEDGWTPTSTIPQIIHHNEGTIDHYLGSEQVLFIEPDTGKTTIAQYKEKGGSGKPLGSRPFIWLTVERKVYQPQNILTWWKPLPQRRAEPEPESRYWESAVAPQPNAYYTYRFGADTQWLYANPVPTPGEEPELAPPRGAYAAMEQRVAARVQNNALTAESIRRMVERLSQSQAVQENLQNEGLTFTAPPNLMADPARLYGAVAPGNDAVIGQWADYAPSPDDPYSPLL
jgi:hypothetical protein